MKHFRSTRAWGTGDGPRAVAVGDFNWDGKMDIVAANAVDNTVSVLLGNGDGTVHSRPDADWFAGAIPAVADFNEDGKVDLLTSGGVYNTLSLMLGRGDGTFEPRVDFDPGTGPAATGDFNHDGKPDFAVIVPCDSSCTSSFVRGISEMETVRSSLMWTMPSLSLLIFWRRRTSTRMEY